VAMLRAVLAEALEPGEHFPSRRSASA
jgi:hypothetical protein